ncbi:hypothetical protein AERO_08235 [Aeromicrobium fastidiosum]|nr:hypothetical protein [Aeromicrobium fastidiosum]MCL8251370.1 hypothetical protein [Aeromicrobium fastidiosum]
MIEVTVRATEAAALVEALRALVPQLQAEDEQTDEQGGQFARNNGWEKR